MRPAARAAAGRVRRFGFATGVLLRVVDPAQEQPPCRRRIQAMSRGSRLSDRDAHPGCIPRNAATTLVKPAQLQCDRSGQLLARSE